MEIAGITIGVKTQDDYYHDPEHVAAYDETRRETAGGQRIAEEETEWVDTLLQDEDPTDITVLDVGGGTGWFSRYLEERGVDTHYLDPSPAMLQEAVEKDGFRKIRGDGASLPVEDNSVDYVISMRTAHVIDPDLFPDYVTEMTRVAEHGVLFDTFRKPSLAQVYHPFLQNPSTLYRDASVEAAVEKTGMAVDSHEKRFPMPYAMYMMAGRNGVDSTALNTVESVDKRFTNGLLGDWFSSVSVWELAPEE